MYRLLVDQSAVILDANDVVLDGENVSCGVEFSVDGTNITGYEYGKKDLPGRRRNCPSWKTIR